MSPAGSPDDIELRYSIYEKVLFLYSDGALEVTDIPAQLIPSASMQLIDECYPVLKFIFDSYCTSCPMPEIKAGHITYRGKGARLLPMKGHEMEDCAWAYAEYQKTGNEEMLDTIIGILYQPKWKIFTPLARKTQGLKLLDPLTKLGIKFWYENCEAWWFTMYKSLYDSGGKPDRKPDSFTISRLIRGLAGPKRGTVDMVRQMNRDEIYFELSELDRENDKA